MSRKKIVLADDVELFLMLEKTFLKRDEFELITARNGQEALKAIQEEKPDLVFMDLYMPVMNGDECCSKVKADGAFRHIPIVMVTSAGRSEDLEKCKRAGCDHIVHKPINRHDFMETVRKVLQVPERETERYNARLRVRYGDMSHELLSNYSIDLSTGGLFLETDHPLPMDTSLDIEFILPENDKTIRCRGRVAWMNDPKSRKNLHLPGGMGIQFLDLTLEDMDAIRDFINDKKLEPVW